MTVRERTEHSSDGFLLTEMKEGSGVGWREEKGGGGRSGGGGGGGGGRRRI